MRILNFFPFLFFATYFIPRLNSQSSSSSIEQIIIKITERYELLAPSIEKALAGHLLEDEVSKLVKDLIQMRREAIEVLNKKSNDVIADIENRLMVQEFKKFLDTLSMIVSKMESFGQVQRENENEKRVHLLNLQKEGAFKPALKSSEDDVNDLINLIKSQTQMLARTCFQAFIKNIPTRF